jgi:hypothetical protein
MAVMLSWTNLADAASIAATREATGLGVRNLLTESVSEVWRIPNVAVGVATTLDVDLGAVATIGVMAFFAPRDSYLPANYTIAIGASAVAVGGVDVLSVPSAAMDLAGGNGAWWRWPATPIAARYLRFTFRAQSGDQYLQLGRMWIGPDFRPATARARDGYRRGWRDAGRVERAGISGITSASAGARYRAPSWRLPLLTNAEMRTVEAMFGAIGTTGQLVVNARTEAGAADLVLGRLDAPPDPQPDGNIRYSAEISMTEDL